MQLEWKLRLREGRRGEHSSTTQRRRSERTNQHCQCDHQPPFFLPPPPLFVPPPPPFHLGSVCFSPLFPPDVAYGIHRQLKKYKKHQSEEYRRSTLSNAAVGTNRGDSLQVFFSFTGICPRLSFLPLPLCFHFHHHSRR